MNCCSDLKFFSFYFQVKCSLEYDALSLGWFRKSKKIPKQNQFFLRQVLKSSYNKEDSLVDQTLISK